MKHVTEFRDPALAKALLAEIARLTRQIGATRARPVHIMEICGGHTHAIFRFGLNMLVDEGVEFIHGPGCPVCVLPMARVDECIEIAEREGVIFTTFGDAMRVPGTRGSLMQAKARGADIRMVYSPLDALEIARRNPAHQVVFFGLGFETTTPATAFAIQAAAREGLENFSVFCNHITVPEPIRALLNDPHMQLDGFIGPGHVSMVIGTHAYDFIAREFGKPIVVAGLNHWICCTLWRWCWARLQSAAPRWKTSMPASCPSMATLLPSLRWPMSMPAAPVLNGAAWAKLTQAVCASATITRALMRKSGLAWAMAPPPPCSRTRRLRLRGGHDGPDKTHRLPPIRARLHARHATGRADGQFRGGVCGLLAIWRCARPRCHTRPMRFMSIFCKMKRRI